MKVVVHQAECQQEDIMLLYQHRQPVHCVNIIVVTTEQDFRFGPVGAKMIAICYRCRLASLYPAANAKVIQYFFINFLHTTCRTRDYTKLAPFSRPCLVTLLVGLILFANLRTIIRFTRDFLKQRQKTPTVSYDSDFWEINFLKNVTLSASAKDAVTEVPPEAHRMAHRCGISVMTTQTFRR
ncbi:MAG: hypothetical protein J6T35_01460 [Bacteroidales bacterium]|nr:hypothetical protein [Bacteroidales bacterium]